MVKKLFQKIFQFRLRGIELLSQCMPLWEIRSHRALRQFTLELVASKQPGVKCRNKTKLRGKRSGTKFRHVQIEAKNALSRKKLRICWRCSAGVFGTCKFAEAFAFALAFDLALGSCWWLASWELATSTNAFSVGRLPTVPPSAPAPSIGPTLVVPRREVKPSAVVATLALAWAETRVRSRSVACPPLVHQKRTLCAHSGASGSGTGVLREMMAWILRLKMNGCSHKKISENVFSWG